MTSSPSRPDHAYDELVDLLGRVYGATTDAVTGLDDAGYRRPTRTAAWSVQDLLFHQMCDAQRALMVFATPHPGPADTDAVSYWAEWSPGGPGADAHARYASKAAAAYGHPSSLVRQWTDTSAAAVRAAAAHDPTGFVFTQGRVLAAGDVVHTLVVEGVVHHLDLTLELPSPGLPDAARTLVLEVLTGLLGQPLPPRCEPDEAILKGTGRIPLSEADRAELGSAATRLPLFG